MWPSVICHSVYLLSTTGQFRLIQLHLRHGLSQWNNYKSADMLPGVVSNFLEGSKAVPYSWWTNILYHMWCTKDTCKSCEKPETTNFKLVCEISEASTPLKKSGRNSIPEIPLWTECGGGGCFFFTWWISHNKPPNNGGLPVAVDFELLWLEFCTDLLVIFDKVPAETAIEKCPRCGVDVVQEWCTGDFWYRFLVMQPVCGFVCSTNAISRTLDATIQVGCNGKKSCVFHGTLYTLPAPVMF